MLQAIRKTTDEFSVREAREITRDLFEPNPRIYWADLLITVMIGTVCLRLLRRQPLFSPLQILGYFGAVLAFYRAGSFTHELVHLRRGTFKWFRAAWNVLVGIPLLMPSFMYYTHIAHHARNHYGTAEDGEYLPLASGPSRNIILYMCQPLLIPIFTVARFLILTPLGWLVPGFRRFVQQRASSMVMDPRYIRPLPSNKELKVWRLQELACFLFISTGVGLFISGRVEPSLAA
ncbi:MAG TPA: fatty acid desaturase, partial [Pirellulales bacterium]|nr:fatty acid desaturase [Pirellulales bacterium]